jgi:osmotically-inducible protein OsmY
MWMCKQRGRMPQSPRIERNHAMTTAIMKTDSQIQADVLAELKWDSMVKQTDVGVQVHDGIVTLTGNVTSYAKKLAARNAAHRVHGVLDVADDLVVKIPTTWERTDEELAKAVRAALKWDVLVPDEHITTTVSNGTVTLQGGVERWTQRSDAEWAIQRLTGVRAVINQITVTGKPADPMQIKRDIEAALERQAEREAKRIEVSVQNGIVTLTGTVRSWGERSAVDRVAGFAPGIRGVADRLTVDPYS